MRRLLPYPLLTASLVVMWLLLNRFSLGHLVLGSIIALVASRAMAALQPAKPQIRRWDKIPLLVWLVFVDICRSNIAVARIVLSRGRRQNSGFVSIPLDLRDRTGLAVLACIVTSTPGTAWLEYNSTSGHVLIHVLDLVDDRAWIDTIKHRYEHLLMEIFE
ncbi:multisubunit potassium/proton antiporter PhaE subunit [Aminobacter aminovorans]|uniref:Mrp complex subunit E1 n=1 Tax=Aminobacter aminovorans TaxID=83263 RepID=A0A381IL53_AMIAI|nr:Na+/H+ antiporter subunit E [Aminobacter aminovorans]TCS24917.1 multisubunit potassium/proton antiporter PhaE subunit [Aminobacter aminovorans]SUY28681.1 Mrp complex subunit E1 [Aminobacter aminovorans]